MDNSKRNIHNSGPLGKLMQAGQIKKVELEDESNRVNAQPTGLEIVKSASPYFKTPSGIKFKENELIFVQPSECEPWEYANRSEAEMGEIEELMVSIQENTQLQPALIRTHPAPTDTIKYQIIFGRRRHEACKRLNIPLLVIRKDGLTNQDAIICQDAENKLRANVSNYSNALLYKKLLNEKTFKTTQELASKLKISKSSLIEMMSYTKIPSAVLKRIPDVHTLPVYMALKIVKLLAADEKNLDKLVAVSDQIGTTINTPAKLEVAINKPDQAKLNVPHGTSSKATTVCEHQGKKLFTFKVDHKGTPLISIEKAIMKDIHQENFIEKIKQAVLECSSGRTSDQK